MDVNLDDALAWIPKAEKMGVYSGTTPRLIRTAADALKTILAEEEQPTLAYISQGEQQLVNRLLRKADVSAATAQTYIKRVLKLLSDYENWNKDPASFEVKPARKRENGIAESSQKEPNKTSAEILLAKPPAEKQDAESISFKLPGSSYEELTKIIKGYLAIGGEATTADVASVTAQDPAEISRNGGFLVSIGVLDGGSKKHLTQAGRNLALALQHEMPEDIAQNWRMIVASNEFLQRIVSAVRIRKGMDETTLRAHIAYTAGQPKSSKTMAGAGAVIDVLRAAGFLRIESGKLVPAGDVPLPQVNKKVASQEVALPLAVPSITAPAGNYSITINVQVSCTPSDLPALASGLRKLMRDLAAPPEEGEDVEAVGTQEDEHSESA